MIYLFSVKRVLLNLKGWIILFTFEVDFLTQIWHEKFSVLAWYFPPYQIHTYIFSKIIITLHIFIRCIIVPNTWITQRKHKYFVVQKKKKTQVFRQLSFSDFKYFIPIFSDLVIHICKICILLYVELGVLSVHAGIIVLRIFISLYLINSNISKSLN